jgi:hypothetical protein
VRTNKIQKQIMPHDHARHLCTFHEGTPEVVEQAITGSLQAKAGWESMPWNDRAAIFLKAADLASGKYRYKLMAATMLGQGKNTWQAEIDAAAEVSPYFSILSSNPLVMFASVGRLLPLRSLLCRGIICPTAAQECPRVLEVRHTPPHRPRPAAHLSFQPH